MFCHAVSIAGLMLARADSSAALTVVEFRTIVDNAVNGVRDGTTASEFAQGYSTYKL